MSKLFTPLTLRGVTARNRIFMSPMCQYSCTDGLANDWHLVHLGSRAAGGAGLVIVEATGVCPEGRISPGDLGLWSSRHADALRPVARFIKSQGSVPCIQIAHAGRKASTARPWDGGGPVPPSAGGWQPLGPSPLPFDKGYPEPKEMTLDEIAQTVSHWERAARLALEAGFEALELHFAHGYLVQSFLSPLSNLRTGTYGGSLEGRMHLALEITERVRKVWPERLPLLSRVSATDWKEGGWDLGQTIILARALKERGVDLLDCSSGGGVPDAKIPAGPDFQVPFAEAVRRETGLPTGAVGFITEPRQAEDIVASGRADAVLLARQFLREPYWPLRAAKELGVEGPWPRQYLRAKP